jgi:hypothetical protein
VSQAIVMIAALIIISLMIVNRAAFKARWGERAFSIAFRWMAIPGLTLMGVGLRISRGSRARASCRVKSF